MNVSKELLTAMLALAYNAGFDRAAKDGMAGFHPEHVKRCKEDGLRLASEIADGRMPWPSLT